MASDLRIKKDLAGETLTVSLSGYLNIKTSPILEEELTNSIDGVQILILDFEQIEYISSAGLRVLLGMEKTMRGKNGKMTLKHVNSAVKEIIRLAGFLQVMNIED